MENKLKWKREKMRFNSRIVYEYVLRTHDDHISVCKETIVNNLSKRIECVDIPFEILKQLKTTIK